MSTHRSPDRPIQGRRQTPSDSPDGERSQETQNLSLGGANGQPASHESPRGSTVDVRDAACDIICRRSLAAICRVRADGRLAAATCGSVLRIHRDRTQLPHLQGVVRATDSAITRVHGVPLTAPPTPAWEELTTDNYKNPYDKYAITTPKVKDRTLRFVRACESLFTQTQARNVILAASGDLDQPRIEENVERAGKNGNYL